MDSGGRIFLNVFDSAPRNLLVGAIAINVGSESIDQTGRRVNPPKLMGENDPCLVNLLYLCTVFQQLGLRSRLGAMIAMTTSNSMRVNPRLRFISDTPVVSFPYIPITKQSQLGTRPTQHSHLGRLAMLFATIAYKEAGHSYYGAFPAHVIRQSKKKNGVWTVVVCSSLPMKDSR